MSGKITESEEVGLVAELTKEVQSLLPYIEFSFSSGSSVGGLVMSTEVQFTVNQNTLNNVLNGGGASKTLIHYTSVESYLNILHSQELRLFDLNYSNDPLEIINLIERTGVKTSKEKIEESKRSIFTTSFCSYNDQEGEDFNMWRLYGNNGRGVGLVFEVMNENMNWSDYILGKVNYGKSNIDQLIKQVYSILDKYENLGLVLDCKPQIVELISVFNKDKIWQNESEMRLATYHKYNQYDYTCESFTLGNDKNFEPVLNVGGNQSGYVTIDLYPKFQKKLQNVKNLTEENKKRLQEQNLQLRIKDLILGYNIPKETSDNLFLLTDGYSRNRIGNYIRTSNSKFKNKFSNF
jgi:hypothetical protein